MQDVQESARGTADDAGAGPLTWRGMLAPVLAGIIALILVALLVRHTEIVTGRYLSSGVPPILAFAGLLLFLGVRPALRRIHPRLCPSRRQALLLYMMLTIGVWQAGPYGVRAFLPHLVALQYWSTSNAALAPYTEELPSWYSLHDPEAARRYYEGSRDGGVPWELWIPLLLRWAPFFLAIFGAALCLMLLMRRQWLHSERLTFPLLYLPLSLASEGGGRFTGDGKPLLRSPILWAGIGVAVLFNALNIAHALVPTVPAPKFSYSLAPFFPNRPWTPLRSVTLFYMLEAIGFGYFVPLDISFSAWFLYVLEKAFAVAGTAAGLDQPGYPFIQEQSAGAYLACGLLLVWGARRHLADVWRRAWERAGEERLAWGGLGVCTAVLVGWAVAAGLALEVAIPYFLVLGCFVLVYARIRAETGVPLEFIYPYGLPKEMVLNAFSVPGVIGAGGIRSMVIFSSLAWLARHHLSETVAAYQIDSLKLDDQQRIGRKQIAVALGIAFAVGLAAALWAHLDGYYQIGSNAAAGGMGEYRAAVALQEYQQMASRITAPPLRDWTRLTANFIGFLLASGMALIRARVPGFPLHPLGFLLATAYGDHTTCFFPLFMAWFAKLLILKVGGLKLYRRGLPFFLGLIIGHFTLAGILWPLLSMLISPEASRSYHLFFGG